MPIKEPNKLSENESKSPNKLSAFASKYKNFLLAALIATGIGTGIYTYQKIKDNEKKEEIIEIKAKGLRKKPIDLGYQEIVKDKDIDFVTNTGNKFSTLTRVSRCLRRKPVTDAIEDRYKMPRGLLMAMMAQEGMGDPTMPNLPWYDKKRKIKHKHGDGGLGLIHIQAVNAHKFGLKTLSRYTDQMIDDKHAELIDKKLKECGYDLSKLIEYDDRFHPIMAVDCAARFFMEGKLHTGNSRDIWINALKRYSGRKYQGYGMHVLKYWTIINYIAGEKMPDDFSRSTQKDIEYFTKGAKPIKEKVSHIQVNIDGEIVGYEDYLAYFEESMSNFELEKYIELGKYTGKAKEDEEKTYKYENKKEQKEPEKENIENTLIKLEFVNTRQHNSQGFSLYRYKVKAGDNAYKISNAFDKRDKLNGDRYKNTGNLNIVQKKGKAIQHMKQGDIVYIKVKKMQK